MVDGSNAGMKCVDFIKQHEYKNYCEIVISPTGDIEYATPSHIYKLMAITGKSREELKQIMPMRASPIHWLVEYTGYCVCWYSSFILPIGYGKRQIAVIRRLMRHGIMSNVTTGIITHEKTVCDAWAKFEETGDDSYIYNIPEVPTIDIRR